MAGESDYQKTRDFNRDLDSYISSRKKRRISFRGIFRSSSGPSRVELPPDVKAYGDQAKKAPVEKQPVETAKEDTALEAEYHKELSQAERGVISRVFSMFKSRPEHVEQSFDEQGNVTVGGQEVQTQQQVEKEFKDFESEEMLGEKPLEEQRGVICGIARFLGLRPKSAPDYEDEIVGGSPEGQGSVMTEQPGYTGQPAQKKEEKKEEVKSDMKDIAKISADILKKLDQKKLEEFKKTPDFIKFKEILRKHNMIK